MGLFNKNQDQETQPVSQRQRLENRYFSARSNILWVLAFTVINVILLISNSNTYFLFSAYIPYAFVSMGMLLCGKYPEEFYGDLSQYEFLDSWVLTFTVVVAGVICLLYLLCWLLAKKRRVGWLIVALVLFSLDTVFMLLGGITLDSILDVLFHCWVIISMCLGIAAHFKLKELPEEEPEATELPQEAPVELPQE